MNLKELLERDWLKKIPLYLLLALLAFYLLRACFPGLVNKVPDQVYQIMADQYVQCIGVDQTMIWPGEPRTPECGEVIIAYLGEGTVPTEMAAAGIERAVCFEAEIRNPYWTTMGGTRHEINWKTRTDYKVALLRNGQWELGPDNEQADHALWEQYACPAIP